MHYSEMETNTNSSYVVNSEQRVASQTHSRSKISLSQTNGL